MQTGAVCPSSCLSMLKGQPIAMGCIRLKTYIFQPNLSLKVVSALHCSCFALSNAAGTLLFYSKMMLTAAKSSISQQHVQLCQGNAGFLLCACSDAGCRSQHGTQCSSFTLSYVG